MVQLIESISECKNIHKLNMDMFSLSFFMIVANLETVISLSHDLNARISLDSFWLFL